MTTIPHIILLSSICFAIGAIGMMIRKNTIVVFMSIELMLNATNMALAAFSCSYGNLDGQIAVFFVMVIAAAEAAVGLAIIISLFRSFQTVESVAANTLKH